MTPKQQIEAIKDDMDEAKEFMGIYAYEVAINNEKIYWLIDRIEKLTKSLEQIKNEGLNASVQTLQTRFIKFSKLANDALEQE